MRKIGHMGNFYANLLSGNVAFGTSKDVPPKHKDDQEGAGAEPAARGSSEGPDSQGASKRGGSEPPRSPEQATDADDEAALAAAAAKAGLNLDKYDLMRLQAEKAMRQRTAAGQGTERSQALDQAGAWCGDVAGHEHAPRTLACWVDCLDCATASAETHTPCPIRCALLFQSPQAQNHSRRTPPPQRQQKVDAWQRRLLRLHHLLHMLPSDATMIRLFSPPRSGI